MYERFTVRAQAVLKFANQEARRLNNEFIGTEHILLGILREETDVAALVLRDLKVDLDDVRTQVEQIVQTGPDIITMGKLPQTPRAKKVIEYAIQEARGLGDNHVGTEHLLLGMLRETDGVGAVVLMNLGISLEKVRAIVLDRLDYTDEGVGGPLDDVAPELEYLPEEARPGVRLFDRQIEYLHFLKEDAVAAAAWERAAYFRSLADKVQALREEFIRQWAGPTSVFEGKPRPKRDR